MDKISTVGVIGSGAMGNGIAQVSAQAGYQTLMFDISETQLDKARATVQKSLQKLQEQQTALQQTLLSYQHELKEADDEEALIAAIYIAYRILN